MLFGVPRRIGTRFLFPFAAAADRDVFTEADVFIRECPALARFLNGCDPENIAVDSFNDYEFREGEALRGVEPENLLQLVDDGQKFVPKRKKPARGGPVQITATMAKLQVPPDLSSWAARIQLWLWRLMAAADQPQSNLAGSRYSPLRHRPDPSRIPNRGLFQSLDIRLQPNVRQGLRQMES